MRIENVERYNSRGYGVEKVDFFLSKSPAGNIHLHIMGENGSKQFFLTVEQSKQLTEFFE